MRGCRAARPDSWEVVTVKNLVWFLFGVVGGFAVAHLVDKDPRGHELLAQVDARISEFTDRIGSAYRDQEARFADVVDDAKTTVPTAVDAAKDPAAEAAGEAVSGPKTSD
jgi:hypothetical protein